MTELQVYGNDGLFHNIVKESSIINGRYAVLEKGANDLNLNNLLNNIELPKEKYPGVFCLPPVSELPGPVAQAQWECFYIRLLFLCSTGYTGDNQFKTRQVDTNTSTHTIAMDWADMKLVALGFKNALEKIQKNLRTEFHVKQGSPWRITRVSRTQNDQLSGVMAQFECELATSCEFSDINLSGIQLPGVIHPQHFH